FLQEVERPFLVSRSALIHGLVEHGFRALGGRSCARKKLVGLDSSGTKGCEATGPTAVVEYIGKNPSACSVGWRVQLTLEEAHPQRVVHDVTVIEFRGYGTS